MGPPYILVWLNAHLHERRLQFPHYWRIWDWVIVTGRGMIIIINISEWYWIHWKKDWQCNIIDKLLPFSSFLSFKSLLFHSSIYRYNLAKSYPVWSLSLLMLCNLHLKPRSLVSALFSILSIGLQDIVKHINQVERFKMHIWTLFLAPFWGQCNMIS